MDTRQILQAVKAEISHLQKVVSLLEETSPSKGATSTAAPKKHKGLSAAGRKRISLAQRARWAKARGQASKPKRTISAAGRRTIAAAARARWAKFRAAKK